eukprot:2225273-Pleurochrysis_carterae.AAC.3
MVDLSRRSRHARVSLGVSFMRWSGAFPPDSGRCKTFPQALHGAAALGAVVAPDTMDSLTASFWSSLQTMPFTHHYMFEACVAVGGFIVWVLFFESLHLFLPRAERYRLDGGVALQPRTFLWTAIDALNYARAH